MAKGYQARKNAEKKAASTSWARGKKTVTTKKGGKGRVSRSTSYEYDSGGGPTVAGKTGEHATEKYKPKAKVYAAGSNALDREKRGKYSDSFKSRGDDPRNWEFHYKDPGVQKGGWQGGKGGESRSSGDRTASARIKARSSAERMAKDSGQDIYDIREIQYNTAGIIGGSDQATADSKAKGGASAFGSTTVAKNLAAQKNVANRKGAAKAKTNTTTRGIA